MSRQPGGDKSEWDAVLGHRPAGQRAEVAARFTECGVAPGDVHAALSDCGDTLYAAARGGRPGWADDFGGPLAVALLAAEVSALAAHLNSRASGVRAAAVDTLLEDFSAVTVATRLGVSRQKVYEISRGGLTTPFIESVPWRQL